MDYIELIKEEKVKEFIEKFFEGQDILNIEWSSQDKERIKSISMSVRPDMEDKIGQKDFARDAMKLDFKAISFHTSYVDVPYYENGRFCGYTKRRDYQDSVTLTRK